MAPKDKPRNTMPWEDADLPDDHAQPTLGFPFVQWVNGKPGLSAVHPVLEDGGFAMPLDQFALAQPTGEIPDGWEQSMIINKRGDRIPALLSPSLRIAVVTTRFAFRVGQGRAARLTATYAEGARGKLQVLGYVDGFSEPVMLTFTGKQTDARQEFGIGHALNRLRTMVRMASALAKPQKPQGWRGFPLYALWLPLTAGERIEVGQGERSAITPVVVNLPDGALDNGNRRDTLRSLWVGNEMYHTCYALWDEAQAWKARWSREALSGNGYEDEAAEPELSEEEAT